MADPDRDRASIRKQRPTYALADAYLQFHYAILEPHRSRLRSRDPRTLWQERLTEIFDSRVRGPVFEQQARTFVERFASDDTVPGERAHVGPSRLTSRGREWELDLVVTDDHPQPGEPTHHRDRRGQGRDTDRPSPSGSSR